MVSLLSTPAFKSVFWKRFFIASSYILFLFSSTSAGDYNPPNNPRGLSWITLLETDAYFWSGIKFGHKIFGGTHSTRNEFQIGSYPTAVFKSKGETAFSFCEFKGKLYLTNESTEIWRLEQEGWKKINIPVLADSTHYFDLTVFGDFLYLKTYNWFTNTCYFYRSPDGENWKRVYSANRLEYISFVYKGELYSAGKGVVAHYRDDAQAVGSKSADGLNFVNLKVLETDYHSWYMFGYEDPVTHLLLLGAGAFYPASYAAGIAAELHLFDGLERKVLKEPDRVRPKLYRFSSAVRVGSKLYVLGDSGYEAGSGLSRLYELDDEDGKWTLNLIQEFDFPCANAMVNYDGLLVVFGGKQSFDPNLPSQGIIIALTTAMTGAATQVTDKSAALKGTVHPNHGLETTYYFQWGKTTAYGNMTSVQSAGSGSKDVPASAALSGLTSRTVYHYRLVATSRAGTCYGPDMTFTTLGPSLQQL